MFNDLDPTPLSLKYQYYTWIFHSTAPPSLYNSAGLLSIIDSPSQCQCLPVPEASTDFAVSACPHPTSSTGTPLFSTQKTFPSLTHRHFLLLSHRKALHHGDITRDNPPPRAAREGRKASSLRTSRSNKTSGTRATVER